jgi:RNA-directed DNA polymerase
VQRLLADMIPTALAFGEGFLDDAAVERCLDVLRERLEQYGLSPHPDKTRLLEFGRHAAENRRG